MSWERKYKAISFENQWVNGLYFLDGDALARHFKQPWTEGQKYPMVRFETADNRIEESAHPMHFDQWEGSNGPVVHVLFLQDVCPCGTCQPATC